jgi:hypothetical protein
MISRSLAAYGTVSKVKPVINSPNATVPIQTLVMMKISFFFFLKPSPAKERAFLLGYDLL